MKIYIGEYFYENQHLRRNPNQNQSILQNKRIGRVVSVEPPDHPHPSLHCTIKWFLSEDEGEFATYYSLPWLKDLIKAGYMGYYYPLVEIIR